MKKVSILNMSEMSLMKKLKFLSSSFNLNNTKSLNVKKHIFVQVI